MLIASNLRRSNRHGPNRTAAQRCATGTAARKKSSHPILQTGNPVVGQQRQAFQQFCCASGRVKRAGPSCPDTSRLTSTSLRLERIVSAGLWRRQIVRGAATHYAAAAQAGDARDHPTAALSRRLRGSTTDPGRPSASDRGQPIVRCRTGGWSAPGRHRIRALNSSRRTD